VHVDLVGPFSETLDGYKYLLTMCDRLSRYLEMVPLKSITASEVTQAFFNNWICRFGVPEAVLSDQGSQFEGFLFTDLLKRLGIKKKRTTAYRPQTNGRLERQHREIKRHLRNIAAQYNLDFVNAVHETGDCDDWTKFIPVIQYRLNVTPSRILGCAPLELIFGFKPRIPEDVAWSIEDPNVPPAILKHGTEYLQWLRNVKQTLLARVLVNQEKYDARRKKYFDKTVKFEPEFKRGDYVRYAVHDVSKMQPNWSQPFWIKQMDGPVATLCSTENPSFIKRVHIANLRYADFLQRMRWNPTWSADSQTNDNNNNTTQRKRRKSAKRGNVVPVADFRHAPPKMDLNLPELNLIRSSAKCEDESVINSEPEYDIGILNTD